MSKAIDLSGRTFGKLTVIERDTEIKGGGGKSVYWKCDCECGNKNVSINGSYLRTGITTNCGCDSRNKLEIFPGKKFEMLTVIREDGSDGNGHKKWLCKCECGNEKSISQAHITKIKSCGCFKHRKEDLTGQKFGMLLVLKRTRTDENRNVYYECLCDCGNKKEIMSRSFKYGNAVSCGCLAKKTSQCQAEDLTGQKFGRLTAIEIVRTRNSKGRSIVRWKCECDCGNTKIISAKLLKTGSALSCGCLNKEMIIEAHRLADGEAAKNSVFSSYRISARSRGLSFSIPKEIFFELIKKDCFYCGKEPSNLNRSIGGYGDCVYNGLDRINNNEGYEVDNVVPCCIQCNRSKSTLTQEEFITWVTNIYNRIGEN